MNKILPIALGAAVLALAACGGGDDAPAATAPATSGTATSTSDVPASATGTTAGLNDYANAQITATSNTSEPVVVGDSTTLPVDNTTETSL